MPKDQTPLLGNGSQEFGMLGYGSLNVPLTVTGPSQEFNVGAFSPRDGENIIIGAVACLAEAPVAAKAFVTATLGSQPGYVKISVYTSALAAAAGSTVTKVNLIAVKGSAVTK